MKHSLEVAARIVNVARSWIGTPFHHQGREKGIGCDCLGLIIGIATELKVPSRMGKMLAEYDRIDYHYHQDSDALLPTLQQHLAIHSKLAVGHIAVLKIQNRPQHLGVIAELAGEPSIIHACMSCQKVVEQPLRHSLQKRICAILTL